MARKKNEYLNNAAILEQINKSKLSYCWFKYKTPDIKGNRNNFQLIGANYDYAVVLSDDGAPNKSILYDEAKLTIILNEKRRKAEKLFKKKLIPTLPEYVLDDLIIRINTFEHIPYIENYNPDKKYRTVAKTRHKLNFVPFKHYKKINGVWEEIVISHYNNQQEFDPDCGKLTNELLKMYILFANKVAGIDKFRNYSYNDDFISQALMQLSIEGLKFDEAKVTVSKSKQLNPFGYYQTLIQNAFLRVLNNEAKHRRLRDDLLEKYNIMPSMTRQIENELWSKGTPVDDTLTVTPKKSNLPKS